MWMPSMVTILPICLVSPQIIKTDFRKHLKSSFFSPFPATAGLIPIPQLSFGILNSLLTGPPFLHMGCEMPEEPPAQRQFEGCEVFLWNRMGIRDRTVLIGTEIMVVTGIEVILETTEIHGIAPKQDGEKGRGEDRNTKWYLLLFYSLLLTIFSHLPCGCGIFFHQFTS